MCGVCVCVCACVCVCVHACVCRLSLPNECAYVSHTFKEKLPIENAFLGIRDNLNVG